VTVARSNRRIVLGRRPTGIPAPSDFARADMPVERPGDGEFLVRNLLLSIDPAQRGWVNASANYADPVPIGGVMRSLAVGVVEESRHHNVVAGEHLYGWFGWQDYCVGSDAELLRKVDPRQAPLSAALGVLGIKAGLSTELIRAHCPDGIDVFFDNTSGEIADVVWPVLNSRARVVQCGTAALPAWDPPPAGPRRDRDVLVKRLRHEGFIIFDHVTRFPAVAAQLAAWLADGSLRYREDIEHGLERAPEALAALYRGQNDGKKIIEV